MRRRVRLERRVERPFALALAMPVLAVVGGLAVGAIVLAAGGHDPIDAYRSMWDASLGSVHGLESTLIKATPLTLTGLAVATALRMGLWNIGAEGQFVLGAVAATGVGLNAGGIPSGPRLLLMFGAALAAGAGWALVAAIPRALIGLNEIITTLFLNYIGILLMDYLIFGPWKDPAAIGFAFSRPLPPGTSLPAWGFNHWHMGVFVALAVAAGLWWLIERTRFGFGVRIAGGNVRAARYLSLPVGRRVVIVLGLSGALAGLAGVIELTGVTQRLQDGISGNYGYTGILIAFLARQRPLAVVVAAFFFATLVVGSYALQSIGVSNAIATILQALIIIFLLLGETLLTYRLRLPTRRLVLT